MASTPAQPALYEVSLYLGAQRVGHHTWTTVLDLASPRGLRQARYDLDALLERLAVEHQHDADPMAYHVVLTRSDGRSVRWRLLS